MNNTQTAPTLPLGYFFRVVPGEYWNYVVQLHGPRKWFPGTKLLGKEVTDNEEFVVKEMNNLVNRHLPAHSKHDIYGEYPPKTEAVINVEHT